MTVIEMRDLRKDFSVSAGRQVLDVVEVETASLVVCAVSGQGGKPGDGGPAKARRCRPHAGDGDRVAEVFGDFCGDDPLGLAGELPHAGHHARPGTQRS